MNTKISRPFWSVSYTTNETVPARTTLVKSFDRLRDAIEFLDTFPQGYVLRLQEGGAKISKMKMQDVTAQEVREIEVILNSWNQENRDHTQTVVDAIATQ